jgi:phosphatidylglycerophosphate synthase
MLKSFLRAPSAWIPFALSFVALALALVVSYATLVGVAAHQDEGTPARTFQALTLAQAVAIAVFAVRWLPRAPRSAGIVLTLQVVAAAVPILVVLVLETSASS